MYTHNVCLLCNLRYKRYMKKHSYAMSNQSRFTTDPVFMEPPSFLKEYETQVE